MGFLSFTMPKRSGTLKRSKEVQMYERLSCLNTATVMAKWAAQGPYALTESCNKAEIFGNFLAHYDDHDEVKNAIRSFIDTVCQRGAPRSVCRDIVFDLWRVFLEPNIDNYFPFSPEGDEYVDADDQRRAELRSHFDADTLKAMDRYRRDKTLYDQNKAYFDELRDLIQAAEEEYGI